MFQKKVHYVSQLGSMDCGIACLTMILNYYGCKCDIVDIGAEIQIGRDGMTLSLPRTPISSISIVTFITTPPPLTAPGNSETFGAPASPFGGSLTGCALKTGCPSWRTRSPGARASIGTMGSGRKTGKGRFPIRTGCALLLILRWRNAPLIWTNFSI